MECDGSLCWTDVKTGDTITGDFTVRNNGEIDSVLQWNVSTFPDWGEWSISPNASILTNDDGWLSIYVEVVAPDEQNMEYHGKVKLVNVMDPTDFCEIEVSLTTPRTRTSSNLLLQMLSNHFPNAFPILRQLIGLI